MTKRMLSILLVFGIMTVFTVALMPQGASAFTLQWTQTDWSGGPGQAIWEDPTAYGGSSRIDTSSVPGSMRLSNITGAAYTKEATNPVVPVGGAGSWDESQVSGLPRQSNGGGYEVVYNGTSAAASRAAGYANSPDGVNWNKSAANPVLQQTGTLTWDQNGVLTGSIVSGGDGYQMFFSGLDGINARRIGIATSPDLQNWSRAADFVFGPGAAGTWEENIDRSRVFREGNGYKMWYLGNAAGNVGRIGYATSPDGTNWTKSAVNPVLDIGAPGSFDETSIDDFIMLPRPWAGDYLIAYVGRNAGGVLGLGMATSADGVTWTKDPASPIITTGIGGTWYQNNLGGVSLGFDGSLYKMWVYGFDAGGLLHTGEFYSFDGLNWYPNGINPVISPSAGPAWDDTYTLANIPFLEGTQLRTFFLGVGTGLPMQIGTATSNPLYTGAPANLESSVFDAKTTAEWGNVTWDETKPANTDVQVDVRCGDIATPDVSWTAWANVANGNPVPHGNSRYIQYRVRLSTTNTAVTPQLNEINIGVKPLTEWYLAEGSTGINQQGSFETWVLIQNPGDVAATVNLFYQTPTGETAGPVLNLDPHTRTTVNVAETVPNEFSVSTRITSDNPVIAERAMYWNSNAGIFRQAAHDSIG
ncbi:MAG: hypothetical protein JW738_09695, partial [Actinobacteria bacterium]|nr:hypothetical protein [Actinomycetota bacterium]